MLNKIIHVVCMGEIRFRKKHTFHKCTGSATTVIYLLLLCIYVMQGDEYVTNSGVKGDICLINTVFV